MQHNFHKNSHKVNDIKVIFTSKPITAWGGIASLMSKYLDQIHFRKWVEDSFPVEETSPNGKGVYPKVLSYLFTVLCGGHRFSHMEWWGHGKIVLQKCFNLDWLPGSSTVLTRFWNNISSDVLSNTWRKRSLQMIWHLISSDGITEDNLNLDSTIITRYGNQEGALKGYNPKKKGRNSHHPLIAFLGNGYVVNIWNRDGKAHSNTGAIEFFEETLLYTPCNFKVKRVLADPGFYQVGFLSYLETKELKYVIRAPMQPTLQKEILIIKNWVKVGDGIDVSSFYFKHKDEKWTAKRKYIVIRQNKVLRKEALGKQLSLFPEYTEDEKFVYNLMITNDEDADILDLWRDYRSRANDENVIKDLKEGYGLAAFSLEGFHPTEAVMTTNALIFHNLIHFLNRKILNKNKTSQHLKTLRKKILIIPATLGNWSRQSVLRLGIQCKKLRAKFKYFLAQIEFLSLNLFNCIAVE